MNGGVLPALLVAVAFALANATGAFRAHALVVFVVAAAIVAFVPIPAAQSDAAHLACWISIVACGATAYGSRALDSRIAFALAVSAGTAAGAVIAVAGSPVAVAFVLPAAGVTQFAARAATRRVPIAPKVVASWLIAVALLATLLQRVPVTPGYLPDHLE